MFTLFSFSRATSTKAQSYMRELPVYKVSLRIAESRKSGFSESKYPLR